MAIVILIDLVAVFGLCGIAMSKGLEAALPFASFLLILVPIESSISLGFFELTTQRLIVAVLVVLYLALARNTRDGGPFPMPLRIWLLIHVLWCVVSTTNSIVPLMSVKKAVSVILEYYVLYFIYWRTISQEEIIRKILFAIAGAVIVCSVFGAFEAYGAGNVINLMPKATHHFDLGPDTDREVRVQSTFDHPILFGAALAMAITIALYLLTVLHKRWQIALLWIGLMLMFLNIYKTSSRGPWLDVMAGFLILGILSEGKMRKYILVLALIAVAAMVIRPGIWGTVKGIYDNSFDMNTSTGTSYEYRFALQHAVTNELMKSSSRFLWGYGLESFYDLRLEGDFLGKSHLFLSCDNAWAELLVETGFVGLLIIAIILLRPLWQTLGEYIRLRGPARYLSLILMVNLLLFYFQMLSVGMYSWGQNGYILWMLIALVFAHAKCREKDPHNRSLEMEEKPAEWQPAFQTV